MASFIEYLYLISGVILPLFYVPQILRFGHDTTQLASYSLSKAACQFLLRVPALLFAVLVVQNGFMNFVLGLDLLGRAIELATAVTALRRQGVPAGDIARRTVPPFLSRDWSAPQAGPSLPVQGEAVALAHPAAASGAPTKPVGDVAINSPADDPAQNRGSTPNASDPARDYAVAGISPLV